MRPEAVAAMLPFLAESPGNPSGSHGASRVTKTALEDARERVAAVCGAAPGEIVFTGSGSEADNLAVKGAARAARARSGVDGVVTTGIEHKAVLGAASRLATEGFRVAAIGAGADGRVDLDALAAAIDERTAVVSVMLVNNETGAVQPLAEIEAIVRERAPHAVLHTDAVQAPQWLDLREHAAWLRPGGDLRPQVRRPEGSRRARRPRRRDAGAARRGRRPRAGAPRRHAERRRHRRARDRARTDRGESWS